MNAPLKGMLALTLVVFLLAVGACGDVESKFTATEGMTSATLSTTFGADEDDVVSQTGTASFGPGGASISRSLFGAGSINLNSTYTSINPYGTSAVASVDVRNATELSHEWVFDENEMDDRASAGQRVTARDANLIRLTTGASNTRGDMSSVSAEIVNGSIEDYSSQARALPDETHAGQSMSMAGGETVSFSTRSISALGGSVSQEMEIIDGSVDHYESETYSEDDAYSSQTVGGASVWYDEEGDLRVNAYDGAEGLKITAEGSASSSDGGFSGTRTTVNNGTMVGYSSQSMAFSNGMTQSMQNIGLGYISDAGASGEGVLAEIEGSRADGSSAEACVRIEDGSVDLYRGTARSDDSSSSVDQAVGGVYSWSDEEGDHSAEHLGAVGAEVMAEASSNNAIDDQASSHMRITDGSVDRYQSSASADEEGGDSAQEIGGTDESLGKYIGAEGQSIHLENNASINDDVQPEAVSVVFIRGGHIDRYLGETHAGAALASTEQSIGAPRVGVSEEGELYGGASGESIEAWSEGIRSLGTAPDEGSYTYIVILDGCIDYYSSSSAADTATTSSNQSLGGWWDDSGARGEMIIARSEAYSDSSSAGTGMSAINAALTGFSSFASTDGSDLSAGQSSISDLPDSISGDEIDVEAWAGTGLPDMMGSPDLTDGAIVVNHIENGSLGLMATTARMTSTGGNVAQTYTAHGDRITSETSTNHNGLSAGAYTDIECGSAMGYESEASFTDKLASAGQAGFSFGGDLVNLSWSGENADGDHAGGEVLIDHGSARGTVYEGGWMTYLTNGYSDRTSVASRSVEGHQYSRACGDEATASLYGGDRKGDSVKDTLEVGAGSLEHEGSVYVKPFSSSLSSIWEAEAEEIDVISEAVDRIGDTTRVTASVQSGSASGASGLLAETTRTEASISSRLEGESASAGWYARDYLGNSAKGSAYVKGGYTALDSYAAAMKYAVEGKQDIFAADGDQLGLSWEAASLGGYKAKGWTDAKNGYLEARASARTSGSSAEGYEAVEVDASFLDSSDTASVGAKGWSSNVYLKSTDASEKVNVYADYLHTVKATGDKATATQGITDADGSLGLGGTAKNPTMNSWHQALITGGRGILSATKFTAGSAVSVNAGKFSAAGNKISRGFGSYSKNVGTTYMYINVTDGSLASSSYSASATSKSALSTGSWSANAKTVTKRVYAKSPAAKTGVTVSKTYHGKASASDSASADKKTQKAS